MTITERILILSLILLSGAGVALADGLIKQAAVNAKNLFEVFQNPLMIPVAMLYVFAIGVFSWAFIKRLNLGIVSIAQIIIYAFAVIIGGMIFFHEKINVTHGIGFALGLIGVLLMNI